MQVLFKIKQFSQYSLVLFLCLVIPPMASAAEPPAAVYEAQVNADFDKTYKSVYKSLEDNRFFVVFEVNISDNLSRFGKQWDNYNLNNIENIKSMVFCNGWYANKVSNADPTMLALCPLRLTMTHKQGLTRVLFARPDVIGKDSKAAPVLKELTKAVIDAIELGLAK